MKLTLLALFFFAIFVMVTEARWSQSAFEADELDDRSNEDYKTAKKHPEELRRCVKCVGIQRQQGKGVKAATDYCNRFNCPLSLKRDLIMNYLRELISEEKLPFAKRK